MQILDVHDDNAHFFHDLARAKRRVLVVDYDHVSAPGRSAGGSGIPCPSIFELLDCIMTTGTQVVLITEKEQAEFARLGPGPAPDVWGTGGSMSPDVMLPAMLSKLGEDAAIAYLSDRDRPLGPLPPTASDACTDPDTACRQAFVQFLIDWLRVCGGEFC